MARRRKVELSTVKNQVKRLEDLLNEEVKLTGRINLKTGEMSDHDDLVDLSDKLEQMSKKIIALDEQNKDRYRAHLERQLEKHMGGMQGIQQFLAQQEAQGTQDDNVRQDTPY